MQQNCCKEEVKTEQPQQVQLIPKLSRLAPRWSGIAVIEMKMQELTSQMYIGKYLVLLFYPCNFSFVCPTELIQFNDRIDDFHSLGAEVVAISTDSKYSHFAWMTTPRKQGGLGEMKLPLLSDKNHRISKNYGVLNESQGSPFRALFVMDRQQIIRHITLNDEDLTRSVEEVLRVVKTCRFVDEHGIVCPYGPAPMRDCDKEKIFFTT